MKKAAIVLCMLVSCAFLCSQNPQLLADINPGPQGSIPYNLQELNGHLLFQAYEPIHGRQLWVTDGGTAGTTLLKEVVSPQFPPGIFSRFYARDEHAWVWARENGQETRLWRTDGTTAGTELLFTSFENTYDFFTKSWVTSRGLLSLRKDPFSGMFDIFLSDGTPTGTGLSGLVVSNGFEASKVVIDSLYYLGYTGTPGNYEFHIYQSDGTTAGSSINIPNAGVSNAIYFQAPGALMNLSGRLSYVMFTDMFPFDGNDQTLLVPGFAAVALLPHQQFGYNFAIVNQRLLYEAPTHPDSMLYPLGLYAFDGVNSLLLLSYQGDFLFGNEADILAATDEWLVLRENRDLNSKLWWMDGTPAGSKLVFDPVALGLPDSTRVHAGKQIAGTRHFLFQTADPAFQKHDFWDYDVATGTLQHLFQFSSSAMYGAALLEWIYFKGSIYFTADDGLTGPELWSFPHQIVDAEEPALEADPWVRTSPNPCSDFLNIRPDRAGWWTLFDSQGRQLWSRQIALEGTAVSLGDLPAGIFYYCFQADNGGNLYWGKLVKQ